jgi:leucyl aminopeptidase
MECGYACSDHASWTKNNFPAIMPAENHIKESIRRIHSPKDVVDQKNNFNYAAHFAKLGVLFAMSF